MNPDSGLVSKAAKTGHVLTADSCVIILNCTLFFKMWFEPAASNLPEAFDENVDSWILPPNTS